MKRIPSASNSTSGRGKPSNFLVDNRAVSLALHASIWRIAHWSRSGGDNHHKEELFFELGGGIALRGAAGEAGLEWRPSTRKPRPSRWGSGSRAGSRESPSSPRLRQRFSSLTGALLKSSRSERPAEPDHHIAVCCARAARG